MKAAFLTAPRTIAVAEVPEPSPAPDEVLVEIRACGICRSDVHYWADGRIGSAVARYPQMLGHEAAGVVVACGREARGLAIGDRVAVEPGLSCGHCPLCLAGRPNCCPRVLFLGGPGFTGAFQERLARKVHQCHRLPGSLSFDDGALLEPMSVGLHAIRRAGFQVGQDALVLGAGSVGLFIALGLANAGASLVIVGETNAWRREKAAAMGFAHVLDPAAPDFLARVEDLTGGRGPDHVLEAAGEPEAFHQAVMAAAIGGTVTLVGICGPEDIALPMHQARRKELDIHVSRRDNQETRLALALAAKGGFRLKDFVTGHHRLDQLQDAFLAVDERRPGILKAMAVPAAG